MAEVLAVRPDSDGDVLLTGPALRALSRRDRVTLLVSPSGRQAARLLPGVADVLVWDCPWAGYVPPAVDPAATAALVDALASRRFSAAFVFTSFHQSALPMALLLRLAGVPRVIAASGDYPGSLLDVRTSPPLMGDPRHEVERALELVAEGGYEIDAADVGLRVRDTLPPSPVALGRRYVVVHPGAAVEARAPRPDQMRSAVERLAGEGFAVVVTGSERERALTAAVAGDAAIDLGGRTSYAELAAVLRDSCCVVVGNTGPAHLAAAVSTPVVSLFAPVVPLAWWRPWGVPHVVLGDQHAPCRDTRARACPVPGHPCLGLVQPDEIVMAVRALAPRPAFEVRA